MAPSGTELGPLQSELCLELLDSRFGTCNVGEQEAWRPKSLWVMEGALSERYHLECLELGIGQHPKQRSRAERPVIG